MDAEQLSIQVEGGGQPVPNVDRALLQCFSSCAKALPADASVWDVSGLVLEGQPVQRSTVVAWLNAVHTNVHGTLFEEAQQGSTEQSVADLSQLLLFADAVGTSRGLLLALDGQAAEAAAAGQLAVKVQLEQKVVRLRLDAVYVVSAAPDFKLVVYKPEERSLSYAAYLGGPVERDSLRQQVVQQTEMLLYLACKLQLPALTQAVQGWVKNCSRWGQFTSSTPVFDTPKLLGAVMSPCVLDTPAGAAHTQQGLLARATTDVCCFGGDQHRQVLRPLDLTAEQQKPLKFTAEVMEDVMTFSKGQQVQVVLDLFQGARVTMSLCDGTASRAEPRIAWANEASQVLNQPVQLLLGPVHDRMLSSAAPSGP